MCGQEIVDPVQHPERCVALDGLSVVLTIGDLCIHIQSIFGLEYGYNKQNGKKKIFVFLNYFNQYITELATCSSSSPVWVRSNDKSLVNLSSSFCTISPIYRRNLGLTHAQSEPQSSKSWPLKSTKVSVAYEHEKNITFYLN